MKRQTIKYLTYEQKKQLLKTLKDSRSAWRSYFMYSLMLHTGLRLSETTSLLTSDVFNGYTAKETLRIKGKGDKVREVPLNSVIRREIEAYIKSKKRNNEPLEVSSPLFLSRVGRRITNRAVQQDFDKWILRAGLEGKFSPHSLRHTVGTELLRKTNNIRIVQEYLGHSFVSTTQVYTHINKEDLKQASELLAV